MSDISLSEKVKKSIERIQHYDPEWFSKDNSYYVAFSGGKDSCVIKRLMDMSGVKYDAHYRVTSVDPPELVRFIKQEHPDVHMDIPRYTTRGEEWIGRQITMWNLIPWKLMPPTRIVRYCCDYLKESGGDGRLTVTGVRWAESVKRKNNQGIVTVMGSVSQDVASSPYFRLTGNRGAVMVNDNAKTRDVIDGCVTRNKTCLNPIIDWTDDDVWDFIRAEKIPVCELYFEGFKRLGCIGCPMAQRRGREREFARWPAYKKLYLRAFAKMLEERKRRGKMGGTWRTGTTPMDVYHWWMEDGVLPGQEVLEEFSI